MDKFKEGDRAERRKDNHSGTEWVPVLVLGPYVELTKCYPHDFRHPPQRSGDGSSSPGPT